MTSSFPSPLRVDDGPGPASSGLPSGYGVTRLVLMPRDPQWMHAYWEVAPYTWAEAERQFGPDVRRSGRAVLQFFPAGMDQGSFDVDVQLDARHWYIRLAREGGDWSARLGLVLPDGRFVLLAISNTIHMPAGAVSDVLDENWVLPRTDWERLFDLSGAGKMGAGSLDMTKMLARCGELFRAISSFSSALGAASSWDRPPSPPAKKFRLVADAEVIVSGATEPDAKVRFQGRAIALNLDGTFSFRFSLLDGERSFPIEAASKDGSLSESIEITANRQTRGG